MPIPSHQVIILDDIPHEVVRDRSWASEYAADAWNYAHSMALVCPKCLRAWCLMYFDGEADLHIESRACAQHGDGRLIGGDYGPSDFPLLMALPEDLLRRELLLTLNHENPQ